MQKKTLTQYILNKGFRTIKINNGVGTFRKESYLLAYNIKKENITIFNNNNSIFVGYVKTKEEFDCLIKMLKI